MNSWFSALVDPALPFVRNALVAGLLSALLFGVLGSLVTVRRMAGLAGAISHAVLGGIGLALFLSVHNIIPGLPPLAGAIVFALLAAGIIGVISLRAQQREDTLVNALWAVGMSLGVIFISQTPGYHDPMTWLFGNILLVSAQDLILLGALDVLVLFLVWRFGAQITAASFDAEFAQVRRIPVRAIYLGILGVVALTVVLVQTLVGIVMVIAMLTLPAGTAGFRARSLGAMMFAGSIWAAGFNIAGQAAAWYLDLPSGAVVVVLAGLVFMSGALIRMVFSRRRRLAP